MLKQMRLENEDAIRQQKNLELARCKARKDFVKEQARQAAQRKTAAKQGNLKKLKEQRDMKQQQIDSDAVKNMQLYAQARAGHRGGYRAEIAQRSRRAPSRRQKEAPCGVWNCARDSVDTSA